MLFKPLSSGATCRIGTDECAPSDSCLWGPQIGLTPFSLPSFCRPLLLPRGPLGAPRRGALCHPPAPVLLSLSLQVRSFSCLPPEQGAGPRPQQGARPPASLRRAPTPPPQAVGHPAHGAAPVAHLACPSLLPFRHLDPQDRILLTAASLRNTPSLSGLRGRREPPPVTLTRRSHPRAGDGAAAGSEEADDVRLLPFVRTLQIQGHLCPPGTHGRVHRTCRHSRETHRDNLSLSRPLDRAAAGA